MCVRLSSTLIVLGMRATEKKRGQRTHFVRQRLDLFPRLFSFVLRHRWVTRAGSVLLAFLILLAWNTAAQAAPLAYRAKIVGKAFSTLHLAPGRAATVWIDVQNTGTEPWNGRGPHFTALNIAPPVSRQSVMQHTKWPAAHRPTTIGKKEVLPGQTVRLRFPVQAPASIGTYQETYQLAVKGVTWISGSSVQLTMIVDPPIPAYRAAITAQSATSIALQPDERTSVWADVKNTGTATWQNAGTRAVSLHVTAPEGRVSPFQAPDWPAFWWPATLGQTELRSGATGRVSWTLRAPSAPGTYAEQFQLYAEGVGFISGGGVTLSVTVTNPPVETQEDEPAIDVGLTTMTMPAVVTASGPVTFVTNDANVVVGRAEANTPVTLSYENGLYTVATASVQHTGVSSYWIVPDSAETVLTVTNFDNRPSWNTTLNDNAFRGMISLRYAQATARRWVINRLPLEQYLRGIAEASDGSPRAYLQALMIAARSYAHYHVRTNTKHAAEHFTVDAVNDQVYRGYNFELRAPNITAAVEATSGMEVTYQGQPVLTPYFAHTDGRTRAWEEVWSGGPYAWLVSVPDPASNGLTMLGHGVGMSGLGALTQAAEGKTHEEILAYYYTGTGLAKQY